MLAATKLDDYKSRLDIYKRLAALHPESDTYKSQIKNIYSKIADIELTSVVTRRLSVIQAIKIDKCVLSDEKVKKCLALNPNWSDPIIAQVVCGRVSVGMTKEQALAGWGRPRDVNTTTDAYGSNEQWVYGEYGGGGYLYFDGELLTSIQN